MATFMSKSCPVSAIGIVVVAVLFVSLATRPNTGQAAEQPSIGSHHASVDQQVDGSTPSDSASDTKVPVQIWTIMAAGGACAVFLLLFLLRVGLGRVAPPPPQEEAAHH